MRRTTDSRGPSRVGPVVLAGACVCMLAVLVNIAARFGWIHLRLPFLTGFTARWVWGLGAVVCFIFAWYIERDSSRRRT
jgi:uncharacterized protein (TIGR04206 family)